MDGAKGRGADFFAPHARLRLSIFSFPLFRIIFSVLQYLMEGVRFPFVSNARRFVFSVRAFTHWPAFYFRRCAEIFSAADSAFCALPNFSRPDFSRERLVRFARGFSK